MSTQMSLLACRRFLPLFVTQFFGALNDNILKNAVVMLVTYRLAVKTGLDPAMVTNAAAALFILPFLLFSATAGQLADKLDKERVIGWIKLIEIGLMILAGIGFVTESPRLLLGVIFLMGVHSTFFGPIKYAILPEHLHADELIGGNALIETGTYLAILLGTVIGGIVILGDYGDYKLAAMMVTWAVLGWLASRFIPHAQAVDPGLTVRLNPWRETLPLLRLAASERGLFLSILGISWFWLVGALFLAQFPTFASGLLHGDHQVVTILLLTFSIGIGAGSLACNTLLHGEVNAKYVPLGSLGITFFALHLVSICRPMEMLTIIGPLRDTAAFLAESGNRWILFDLFGIAFCGGVYSVPLYAILQVRSDSQHRSRLIAANNVMNALFMVVAAVATMFMLSLGWTIPDLFFATALLNLVVAIYICGLLPDEILKMVFAVIFKVFYRVERRGWENFANLGPRVLIVANHQSFLDAPLLATFFPASATFAINSLIAKQWWVRPFLSILKVFPMDPTNPMAVKALVKELRGGLWCVIFPEGRITVTGSLMKIYEGTGLIADKADAEILPVHIEGAQYSKLSRLGGIVRQQWFPHLIITVFPPRKLTLPEGVTGRARRRMAGAELYKILTNMLFEASRLDLTLFQALIAARKIRGGGAKVLEDTTRQQISLDRLLVMSYALGERLAARTEINERVGVLLPNSVGTVTAFFGLHAFGRVPAMLNYSTGLANMQSACRAATIRLIITSRRFIEAGHLEGVVAGLAEVALVVELESLAMEITPSRKMVAWWQTLCAHRQQAKLGVKANAPAVVLFTSGSEGTPKGVVLSHRNFLANTHQFSAVLDINPTDMVFNAMPLFHSFGLTGGLLMPLLMGVKIFLYPSPLHYRIIPELVYDTRATILFATDTFLAGYARTGDPYDFRSLRHVFAGAEKVRETTRKIWFEKYGLRILEGYGATETAPVLAVNTPMHSCIGTVGKLLPGIQFRLEAIPGIAEGGKLLVKGANVMLGYLRAERPGEIDPPVDGWYDTGDIVDIDEHGYVTIKGRAKRFAKMGGEMVSLTAVEQLAMGVWPKANHAVVAIGDERRGEQLVLVTTVPEPERRSLLEYARANGLPELMVPKSLVTVDKIPLLGSGKVDYPTVQKLVTTNTA